MELEYYQDQYIKAMYQLNIRSNEIIAEINKLWFQKTHIIKNTSLCQVEKYRLLSNINSQLKIVENLYKDYKSKFMTIQRLHAKHNKKSKLHTRFMR